MYSENFENGPGGWLGWASNDAGALRLPLHEGAVISRGPWWIDYNHAPPGGGYLHLLFVLHTHQGAGFPEQYKELGGPNRFVEGGYPRDLTKATVRARLRGSIIPHGARCRLLVQSKVRGKYVNVVFTGGEFAITPEWSWQAITLEPDERLWTQLGSRSGREATYGEAPIGDVLGDVNGDIIFVLYPLDVRPASALDSDPHLLRAEEEYAVDRGRLPHGEVMMDEIRIEWNKE
ncbi:MAG: hypothetical protein IT163_10120 [Bryobacterales bacterium]|nr:hypothetical protein [Bryobacterales bacterium]